MTTEELDFNRICRVCCMEGQMMSVFKVHIHKKLMAFASIQVWQNDGLPGQICTKCIAKLHIAFQFKKICEKSDARLRQYLSNLRQDRDNQQQSIVQSQEGQQSTNDIQQQTISSINAVHNSNEYVFVECAGNPIGNPDIKPFDTMIGNPYGGTMQQPYSLQNIPSVQFQTYNVQIPQTNQILTLTGQCSGINSGHFFNNVYGTQNNTTLLPPALHQECTESEQIHSKHRLGSKPSGKLIKQDQSNLCNTCGKHFGSAIKLNRHMKTHSHDMPYRCKICHKGFSHSGNFKVHMRMHNDERPYQCTFPLCDRACRQQQDLEKHMRTHTGERPHLCHVCNKAFSTSSNLIAHSRIHSGEKPYVCSVCQKAFCQSNELTKHSRTHTGEKSHICKLCNKGFNGSSTLVVHMRTHTGERPYICNLCNKGFTQSSCLQVHMKRHNNIRQQMSESDEFLCTQCEKNFTGASNIRNHLKSHNIVGDMVD